MAQSPSNCLRKSTASRATKMRADSGMLSIESPERRRPVGGQQRRTRRTAGRRAVGHRCRARCTRRNRRPEHPRKGRRPGGARRTLAAVASSDGDDTHGCSASRRECPIAWRGRRRTRRCGHARRGVGRWLRAGGPEGGRGGGRCGMMSSAHGRTTGRAIPGGVPGTVTLVPRALSDFDRVQDTDGLCRLFERRSRIDRRRFGFSDILRQGRQDSHGSVGPAPELRTPRCWSPPRSAAAAPRGRPPRPSAARSATPTPAR